MQFIYHIHTKYCHHASNTIKGIVDLALKEGYKTLYITEHCPLDNNNYLHFRTTRQGIVSLKKEIDQANKKNKNKLTIYFGYEIEYNKVNKKYFDSFKKDDYVNFLIFGNHYVGDMWKNAKLIMDTKLTDKQLDEYLQNTKIAFKSKCISWFAHPEIWLAQYKQWNDKAKWLTQQLINLSIKYKVPMGFNANGLHTYQDGFIYPSQYFWKEVAKSKAKVLIEADAHELITMTNNWLEKTKKLALSFGLKKNLVEKPTIRWLHN